MDKSITIQVIMPAKKKKKQSFKLRNAKTRQSLTQVTFHGLTKQIKEHNPTKGYSQINGFLKNSPSPSRQISIVQNHGISQSEPRTIMPARKEYQITGDFVFRFKQNTQIYGHLLEQRFGLFERRENTKFVIFNGHAVGKTPIYTRNPDGS